MSDTDTLYSGAGDGWVGKSGAQGTWAATRGSATGSVTDDTTSPSYGFITQNDSGGCLVYRAFLPFFIGLEEGSIITSATLSVMGQANYVNTGDSGNITEGIPASPSALTTDDFNKFGDTVFSTAIPLNFANESYNDFILNADGLIYLKSKIGTWAIFCLRGTHDIANTDPGNEANGHIIYLSEAVAGKKPKLVITYTRTAAEPFNGFYYH